MNKDEIDEGYKDYLVECEVRMATRVWCRAKSKKDAERIVERAWNDGYIEVDWDDDPRNTVSVVEQPYHIEKGDQYFRERTDGSVEEVTAK